MSFFVESEAYYKKHAKRSCKSCEGDGQIPYYVDQDWIVRAPCIECFPNDVGAQRAEKWWAEVLHAPRARAINYP